MHYTVFFFATWELLLCGEGHTKGDQEGGRKKPTKWNCLYKSVSHYAFGAQIRKPLYGMHAQSL